MKLTPSAILKYLDCPRAYYHQYVERLRPQVQSSNLHFGQAIHSAIHAWLTGVSDDPADYFAKCWHETTETVALDYNTQWTPESLLETGKALAGQFPAVWEKAGIFPILDEEGQPVLERRLEVRLAPDFVLSGQPDLLGMTLEGEVVVLDFKTASNPAPEGFARMSDQLAAYQVIVEAHAGALGIHRVDRLGFLELIKRKVPNGKTKGKGPEVMPPVLAPRQDAREFVRKALWVAANIEAGNFFPNPRMAWNSPCGLCDFKRLCYEGSYEGLVQPEIYD